MRKICFLLNIECCNEVLTGQHKNYMEENKNQYFMLTVNIILVKYLIQRFTIKGICCISSVSKKCIIRVLPSSGDQNTANGFCRILARTNTHTHKHSTAQFAELTFRISSTLT